MSPIFCTHDIVVFICFIVFIWLHQLMILVFFEVMGTMFYQVIFNVKYTG